MRGEQQGDEAQSTVRRITGELAESRCSAIRDTAAVVRNAKRALRRASGHRKGRLRRAINDLQTIAHRAERVITQTRS